tara:strand:- start:622 stop:1950 length:1329 start_codon:yes stop_codon:yes gene_type:complete
MKLLYALVILSLFNSCSFDNKSGIWKNENSVTNKKDDNVFKDFEKIISSTESFNDVIQLDTKFNFNLKKNYQNDSWLDIFYNDNNNIDNLSFSDKNKVFLKSKKLTKYQINKYTLFENNNFIFSDEAGNIIVYSLSKNLIIAKKNFYKKKYKNIKKKLNIIIKDNIIYVSDNIGYVYAYNYEIDQMLWAKDFKTPFRSNIKISSKNLIVSNENNDLLILNINTGDLKKLIPSEEMTINNSFINNIVLGNEEIFFLNTYGSLYSIDNNDFRINWFINLNNTLDLSPNSLFFGSSAVYNNQKVLLSSSENFYILNGKNGSVFHKKNLSSLFKPIINNKYIFLVTKNNFLISMELESGKIIYSYDISQKVANFINSKKKKLEIKNFMIINDSIYLFLKNSHVIQFNINGEITKIVKLPSNLKSYPIFAKNYLLYLDKKNKLFVIN